MDDDFAIHGPDNPRLQAPVSFLVFAVAKLNGQYRQLAIARHETWGIGMCHGKIILRVCRRVITTLSDPANRTAVEGELALAEAAYAHHGLAPPRSELRSVDHYVISDWNRERVNRWWNQDMVEFPFISTCLVVSVGSECNDRRSQVTAGPLGLVYTETMQYGMAVVDISDLDHVRYGIVAFGTFQPLMPNGEFAELVLEPARSRQPLSAKAYMNKFASAAEAKEIDKLQLEKYQLVGLDALEVVWPDRGQQQEQQHTGGSLSSQVSHESGPRSLGEQAAAALVRRLVEALDGSNGDLDSDLFRETQSLPNFPEMLRTQLHQHAHNLHQSAFATDVLRTAYAEQTHLDWVTFSHLSPAVIGSALKGLKHARSISLCIDQINGTPAELISALAAYRPPFDSLYLHQTPTRQTDQPTADLLAHLAAHPQLARAPNLFLTGIFSASLRRTILLPPQTFTPRFPPFLIQHLFLRHNHPTTDDDDDDDDDSNGEDGDDSDGVSSSSSSNSNDSNPPSQTQNPQPKRTHWPVYYYLGDTPYRAERFATGFLHLLQALAQGRTAAFPDPHSPDDLLRDTLCGAPPTLRDDLFVPYEDEPATGRVQITPLPCENRSVPWLAARCGVPRELLFRRECWPLVRTPDYSDASESEAAGLWSVVVDVGVSGEDGKPVVGYAFVRGVVVEGGEEKVRVVGGLRELLAEAAPEVDGELVERRLEELDRQVEELERSMSSTWDPWPVRRKWVHTLGEGEAREILNELLLEAKTFGRNMLRVAMLARPEDQRWYPQLLEDEGAAEEARRFLTEGLPRPSNTLGALFELSSDDEDDNSDSDDSDDEARDMIHVYPGPD